MTQISNFALLDPARLAQELEAQSGGGGLTLDQLSTLTDGEQDTFRNALMTYGVPCFIGSLIGYDCTTVEDDVIPITASGAYIPTQMIVGNVSRQPSAYSFRAEVRTQTAGAGRKVWEHPGLTEADGVYYPTAAESTLYPHTGNLYLHKKIAETGGAITMDLFILGYRLPA